jgi:hypothetical protein
MTEFTPEELSEGLRLCQWLAQFAYRAESNDSP